MKNSAGFSRRRFLQATASLAALAATGARATQVGDYKALVCINLAGGNDGNNLIVPLDAPWAGLYSSTRGSLALSGNKLLAGIDHGQGLNARHYALHYALPRLKARYGNGVAFVLNCGVLDHPLTRAQVLAGDMPANLFSHSDQTISQQSGQRNQDGSGWGGRLLDQLGGSADPFAAISTATPATFLRGAHTSGNVITPGSGGALAALSVWDQTQAAARRDALDAILTQSGGSKLIQAANATLVDGLNLAASLHSAGLPPVGSLGFPTSGIGLQLEQVARLISFRSQQGPGRQVFICTLGGFDTHSGQDYQQWDLLNDLDQALDAFLNAIAGPRINLASQVTAFTQSEFGRTLQPSGTGSDHGWGSHHIVAGGAVRNGVYGVMPDFTLGANDDANNRGVWIPRISHVQFAATLGKWFGATPGELGAAFPELIAFAGQEDLGFMS